MEAPLTPKEIEAIKSKKDKAVKENQTINK